MRICAYLRIFFAHCFRFFSAIFGLFLWWILPIFRIFASFVIFEFLNFFRVLAFSSSFHMIPKGLEPFSFFVILGQFCKYWNFFSTRHHAHFSKKCTFYVFFCALWRNFFPWPGWRNHPSTLCATHNALKCPTATSPQFEFLVLTLDLVLLWTNSHYLHPLCKRCFCLFVTGKLLSTSEACFFFLSIFQLLHLPHISRRSEFKSWFTPRNIHFFLSILRFSGGYSVVFKSEGTHLHLGPLSPENLEAFIYGAVSFLDFCRESAEGGGLKLG